MTLSEKQRRFTWLLSCLIDWAYNHGYEIVIGEVYRTPEQQAIYIKKGKSKTASSKHQKCLAADLNLFKDDIYLTETKDHAELGIYWQSLDPECIWGGTWGWDGNHYQYTK